MNWKTRHVTGAALLAAPVFFALLLAACSSAPREVLLNGPIMGTQFNIKYLPIQGAPDPDTVRTHIEEVLIRIDMLMSTYKPDSELSRFNALREDTPFLLSPDTAQVFGIALEVSRMSGGAFDVTVGPLVNAYGFGPQEISTPPSDIEIASLKSSVGYALIELDSVNGTLRKLKPEVYCDLSAVAKGYAVDKVAESLEQLGITNYMVEIGGEVRVRGHNAAAEPWHIAIELPDSDTRSIHKVLTMGPGGKSPAFLSLATSGDYRNYYEENGVRISHTIDPRTGKSIAHSLASVSVLHESCAWADALATAFMVLGPDDALALAEKHRIALYMLVRTSEGFTTRKSSAFPSLD